MHSTCMDNELNSDTLIIRTIISAKRKQNNKNNFVKEMYQNLHIEDWELSKLLLPPLMNICSKKNSHFDLSMDNQHSRFCLFHQAEEIVDPAEVALYRRHMQASTNRAIGMDDEEKTEISTIKWQFLESVTQLTLHALCTIVESMIFYCDPLTQILHKSWFQTPHHYIQIYFVKFSSSVDILTETFSG